MSYIILDPIANSSAGVTTYSILLQKLLIDNDIDAVLLSNKKHLPYKEFYSKVQSEIDLTRHFIEFPERNCFYIHTGINDNARLHGNTKVLNDKQNIETTSKLYKYDKHRILCAKNISSPSVMNAIETKNVLGDCRIKIYPNPIPCVHKLRFMYRDIDYLFFGRFFKIKGVQFLREIEKKLHNRIAIHSSNISFIDQIINCGRIKNDISKQEIFQRTKVVVIPSLYESFSMVKYEALSYGCSVITWDTVPLMKNERELGVFVARSYDTDMFADLARLALMNFNSDEKFEKYKEYSENNNAAVVRAVLELLNDKK